MLTDLIRDLTALPGVSGAEEPVRRYLEEQLRGREDCRCTVDNLGNLIVEKQGRNRPARKVLLSAHMDEVGLIVTHIEESGFLRFDTVGGISPEVLAGKRVYVGEGLLPALTGIKAIHQQKPEERTAAPSVDQLYIDIGARSREEAEELVRLGDRVTFAHNYARFGDGFVRAKALDDRASCAILLRLLLEESEYDFTAAFTVQEETGCTGAKTAAYAAGADVSIVAETTTAADIPGNDEADRVAVLGKGPVISFMDRGTIYDMELFRLAGQLAAEEGIPCQSKTRVAGGNESRSTQTAGRGARVAAVSIPCRYLHSQAVVMKEEDAEQSLRLIRALCRKAAEL